MPPGVINMVTGDGINVSKAALADPDLAGIHFTGSTPTFQHLWSEVGTNLGRYRTYPRLVGETGGKDFILAHPSADPAVLRTAMIRGAFEFQGQKCSAASRAYVPASIWKQIKGDLVEITNGLRRVTSPTCPTSWAPSSTTGRSPSTRTRSTGPTRRRASTSWRAAPMTTPSATSCARPSSRSRTPTDESFRTEYFGPILSVHVYPDRQYDRVLDQMEGFAPFALDRLDHRPGPPGHRRRDEAAALRSRQLLRQRQADRCRRRAAALRWRSRVGHERQGRRGPEPAPLDERALDQGDLRPADQPRLPAHGLTRPRA